MPARIQEEELEAIIRVVTQFPTGVAIRQLLEKPEINLKRRTLQRRIDLLIDQGKLTVQGEARARKYLTSTDTVTSGESEKPVSSKDVPGMLSAEALELRRLMSQPLSARTPVSYQHGFLKSYEPNNTFYLPKHIRNRLREIGRPQESVATEGTYLQKIFDRLLIDLSWSSSRLEGNTYSLLDTKVLIERGLAAEGKDAEEAQMILNHKAAIELLMDKSVEIGFNRYTICNLHALLSENLLSDPGACGRIRSRDAGITGTLFEPLNIPQGIEEFFDTFLVKCNAIEDPFEQALFAMVHIPYLQPFEDVNKRVSRLAANIPLIHQGFCPLSYADMHTDDYTKAILSIYELTQPEYLRDVFVWAYERSVKRFSVVRQSLGEPDPFRTKYKQQMVQIVSQTVRSRVSQKDASTQIQNYSNIVNEADRSRFILMIETELINLHMGNIARYRLKPSEFEAWKQIWGD